MKNSAHLVVAASVFAASCSYDLGSLQGGLVDSASGGGGSGGDAGVFDAPTTQPDTLGALAGSGGRGDAGVTDAPAARPDVPIGGSGGGAGGISGVGGTGGGSTVSVGGTSSGGSTIVSFGGTTASTGGRSTSGGTTSAGGMTITGGISASGGTSSGGTSASGATPQSCSGLAATCGPLGNDDCCKSLLVPGGTFDRSYDDLDFTDPNYPATVSDFYLDKYEITVGRFRAFVNAGMGTQASPPASGAGAHPLIAGSGWDSTWNTNLPKDTTSLRQAMDDCGGNWTDRALSNESQPQNCLDWYTAFAFCAWDGGMLPTEAEWNYAASGGKEQRYYPWSSPPTSTTIDDTYAIYCGGSCSGTQNVGSRSPKGDGKWGQSDLGGNIGEWTLDWYAEPYSMPCDNCAYLTEAGSCPVARGGVFDEGAAHLRSAGRGVSSLCAKGRYFTLGARCARTSYGTGTGAGDAGVPDAPGPQPDVPMGGSGGGTGGAGGIGGGGAGGGAAGSTGGTSIATTTGALGRSCTGLPATCGPSGNESCCTNLLVPGGTFYRSNDTNYPATVSDFYLDKYETTVGRFRAFVNAGMGTQANPPAPGAGANPLIAGSGWDSTWNTNLPADTPALKATVKCNPADQTWTDTPGGNESQPQNCLTWFEAAAFCTWDGGRLPTEAEWNYAAAGGNEQRVYPWSVPPMSATIDDSYAVYCGGSCNNTQNVGSKSPKGDGKWGHTDLAGNVWEWALDFWSDPYPTPCDNCAALSSSSARVIRGGYFGYPAYILESSYRYNVSPDYPGGGIGVRCAKSAQQ